MKPCSSLIMIACLIGNYYATIHPSHIHLKCESPCPLRVYIPHIKLHYAENLEKHKHLLEKIFVFKVLSKWLKDISMYTQEPWPEISNDFKRYCFETTIPHNIIRACNIQIVSSTLFSGISVNCGEQYRFAIGSAGTIKSYAHDMKITLLDALNTEKLIVPEAALENNNKLWKSHLTYTDLEGWNAYTWVSICGRIPKKIVASCINSSQQLTHTMETNK
jgi:hypothetical protein